MIRMLGTLVLALTGLGALTSTVATVQDADAPAAQAPEMNALETRFQEELSGAQLVGFFTLDGMESDAPLTEDRYTISSVSKVRGDLWRFETRIQYGERDATVAIPLQVKWAGDTPVITLTDLPIPGMGRFTARVLIYRGQYAGTWSGGDHGGKMFGDVRRPATDENPVPDDGG